jgi:hypothetical protein
MEEAVDHDWRNAGFFLSGKRVCCVAFSNKRVICQTLWRWVVDHWINLPRMPP